MVPFLPCLAVLFTVGRVCSTYFKDAEISSNEPDKGTVRTAWYITEKEKEPEISVIFGYYPTTESHKYFSNEDTGNDSKYSVPTSFADFIPGSTQDQKSQYNYVESTSYKNQHSVPLTDWEGYSSNLDFPSPWTTKPSDMVTMMDYMKHLNPDIPGNKQTGLFAKLKSEPLALVLATTLPLTIILSSVLPQLANLYIGGVNSGVPTITTTATGNRGRMLSSDRYLLITQVMEAIRLLKTGGSWKSTCFQKAFCEATRKGNGKEGRSIQRNVYRIFTFVDDYWLKKLGIKELMAALGNGNCDNIRCSSRSTKKRTYEFE